MATGKQSKNPSTRDSPAEREQAVRLVRQLRKELGTDQGTVGRVARQLGYGVESVRSWVKQADIDQGVTPGTTTAETERIRALEQENREPSGRTKSCVGPRHILRGGARPPVEVIVGFIDENRDELGVEPICRDLQVAPSTYYAAKSRPLSARAVRDAVMIPILLAIWQANYSVYGAHKIWKAAHWAGHYIGRDQVARLMRQAGIRGVKRGRRIITTRGVTTKRPARPTW